MRRWMLAATVSVLVAGAAAGARAQATPPAAEAVLDSYVSAIGGRAALDKLTTRVIKARLESPSTNTSMPVSTWMARPDRARTIIDLGAAGRIERGFDGSVGWEIITASGSRLPRVYTGTELDDAVRDNRFDGFASWREWLAKADVLGSEDVDGKPAWKVLVTPKRGTPQTYFFDRGSSLIVKLTTKARTPTGDVPLEIFFGDYRDVGGGVLMPHRVRQVAPGQEFLSVLESVALNAEIPAGQFDLPKEIQELVAKK